MTRIVNVHESKTNFSRLMDADHAGEIILVPLEQPSPKRQPGVLEGMISLPPQEVLLEPLPEQELSALEEPLL